jgi:amidohydrolase
MLLNRIKELASQIHSTVIEYRRHLHAHPELSFLEYNTSAYIKDNLDDMGITWEILAGTGIVAVITGDRLSDQVVALRADIDALPITELNDLEYASRNKGVMHACGHDAHTASLLGTAFILQSLKSNFGGSIKLIFQPGEEKLPSGASMMIKEGVLENPAPQAIIGQHVMPFIPAGKIGICKGEQMASMDEIYVTVHGKGGHGAMPHQNIDPVLITAYIIVALQQIISRFTDPIVPSVLSFGRVVADGSNNVIPDQVSLQGTFRTLNEQWRVQAHGKMKMMAESIAMGMGGTCDFQIAKGYPVLMNEEKLTEKVQGFAKDYLGEENVVTVPVLMVAEDFAYYSQITDSCFYLLGVGNKEKQILSSLHTPTFNIDEDALLVSTGLMAYIAVRQLETLR